MKSTLQLIFVIQIIIVVCLGQKYTTRYDNINIDEILSNKRVLNNYVKCILDEGPCTAEGRELRAHIPEALQTNCAKCSDSQKRFVKKGANFLKTKSPIEWSRISRKFDPERKYVAQFNEFLNT
ncbi:hypothetical protein ABEB36_009524 [Hypothenemus hampei]|uniref:Uncharacterized protein n=1 Tax=Hypothenemus hampei TaxID=57062 RepID=A0ABD1EIS6_HYPHA